MIALRFTGVAHQLRVAKLLGLIPSDATEIPAAYTLTFTPTQAMLDALGLTATPDVAAILDQSFTMRLHMIGVEYWDTGSTHQITAEDGSTETIAVTAPVYHRVNIDPMGAPAEAVAFLTAALGNLVIDDATRETQGDRITTW